MIPVFVNRQQVSLQANGEWQSSVEAKQAAQTELSFRIANNVQSRINSYQELRKKNSTQTVSYRLRGTSDFLLLGRKITIIAKNGTYFATARLAAVTALPLYKIRIDELVKELDESREIREMSNPIRAIQSLKAALPVLDKR